jgi:hypothetical protein
MGEMDEDLFDDFDEAIFDFMKHWRILLKIKKSLLHSESLR